MRWEQERNSLNGKQCVSERERQIELKIEKKREKNKARDIEPDIYNG